MCDEHESDDPTHDGVGHHHHHHATAHDQAQSSAAPGPARQPGRRTVLGGVAAAVTAPLALRGGPASAATPSIVTGLGSQVAAMHMHASFSEQQGSWQGQAWRMKQESVDLMFMTDHSHGLMATHMASDLTGTSAEGTHTGTLRQQVATISTSGQVSLRAESASSRVATSGVITSPGARPNRLALRTSVMGQTLSHTFGAVSVGSGGTYEVRVGLSHHPATRARPEGIYGLCYRFGPGLAVSRSLEDGGLTAVVTAPLPPSGTTVQLDLTATCRDAWPDVVPEDNGTQWFSFTAVSPRSGVVVDVTVTRVAFGRVPRTAAAVGAVQQAMASTYSAQWGVAIAPGVELGSRGHHNAFTPTQYFAPDEELGYTDLGAYIRANVAAVHAQGGLLSWNHPFGADIGIPLTGDAAVARRRAVYSSLAATNLHGCDILEVGYALRGKMSIEEHMGLWDTFSRHGRFITANGVSDSHDSAHDRRISDNEFVTGIWASSTGMSDILPALGSGRAYTRHSTRWPGGELDLVVDGTYLMGQVVVGPARTRRLTVTATALPQGSVVQVVASPVDYKGVDPTTRVVDTVPASVLGRTGITDRTVSLPDSGFVRLTVRDSLGAVIGISNPVWLLTQAPPTGVPASRARRG